MSNPKILLVLKISELKSLEQHMPEPDACALAILDAISQYSPTGCFHKAGIKLSTHIFSQEIVDHEL
jgi:hypothetical protein